MENWKHFVMSELLPMTSHKPGVPNLGQETSFSAVCCSEREAVDDDLYMCSLVRINACHSIVYYYQIVATYNNLNTELFEVWILNEQQYSVFPFRIPLVGLKWDFG